MATRAESLAITALVVGPLALSLLFVAPASTPAPTIAAAPSPPVVAITAAPVPALEPPACPEPGPAPAPEPEAAPVPLDVLGARLLVHEGKVVLASQVDLAWATGPIHNAFRDWTFYAWQAVDAARLPPEIAALPGSRVVVYDGEGGSCEATIGEPRLHVEVVGDIFPDEHPSARERRQAAVERMTAPQGLVADLVAPTACNGLWARLAELPPPVRYTKSELGGRALRSLRPAVMAEIRRQPEYQALRREFAEDVRDRFDAADDLDRRWRDFVREGLEVTRWEAQDGRTFFYAVTIDPRAEACSDDFYARTAWILDPAEDGALARRPGGPIHDPRAFFDGDGDGLVEAVRVDGFGLWTIVEDAVDGPIVERSYELEYYGCPC